MLFNIDQGTWFQCKTRVNQWIVDFSVQMCFVVRTYIVYVPFENWLSGVGIRASFVCSAKFANSHLVVDSRTTDCKWREKKNVRKFIFEPHGWKWWFYRKYKRRPHRWVIANYGSDFIMNGKRSSENLCLCSCIHNAPDCNYFWILVCGDF